MKHHFVLDENILICAATGRNPLGAIDSMCFNIVNAIDRQCHALVYSPSTLNIYYHQIKNAAEYSAINKTTILRLLSSLLRNSDKDHRILGEGDIRQMDGLSGMRGVDQNDGTFFRMAASVPGAILVTQDGPLIEALTDSRIAASHGVRIPTLIQVLSIILSG